MASPRLVVEMAIADVKLLSQCMHISVEEALAYGRAAEARNAICRADLALELVVVRKLFVCGEGMKVSKSVFVAGGKHGIDRTYF